MSENNSPLQASVIIPIWNGRADLPTCLTALMAQTDVTFEVIAVDDESSDDSVKYISTHFPQVRLLRTGTNSGFSKACNVGLRHATGETLVLLNQDTQVKSGWLAALINIVAQDEEIGIAGSKAHYADGTIQHVGGEISELGYGGHIGAYEQDSGQFDEQIDVDYVTGASMAISQKVYQEVGGFDENFDRAYYEDVDLCYRVRDAGYRVVYEPTSVLIHNERSVIADGSLNSDARLQKNRLRFVFKNWPTDKLVHEFVPAEKVGISHLNPENPMLVNSIRRAYLRLMMASEELSSYRRRRFDDNTDVFRIVQSFWLDLEMDERLRSVAYNQSQPTVPSDSSQSATQLTAALSVDIESIRQKHPVRPQPFRSSMPLLGPLIAGFRQRWNRVSTEWFVRPILQQQNEINTHVIQAFDKAVQHIEEIDTSQKQATHLQSAYIIELAQQISQLEETVQELREQIVVLESSGKSEVD